MKRSTNPRTKAGKKSTTTSRGKATVSGMAAVARKLSKPKPKKKK
jgi:hypothetical protein